MLKTLARNALRQMGARYNYDVSYMEALLDASPDGFMKFGKLSEAASHRESAPLNAFFAAKIVGDLAEDCGPCVQLVVNMALEAGVAPDQIEAVLHRDLSAMHDDTALGYRFADAVVRRSAEADDIREQVRALWGDKGVIDLTFGLQIGRVFPMVKAGLGHAKACQRVVVGERPVDVVKTAA